MKKNSKKALSVALCSFMALATACGGGGTKESSSSKAEETTKAAETTAAETSAAEAKAPYDKYEPVDMGGRTFTLVYNWDMIPATSDTVLDSSANQEMIGKLENLKRIEKKYNCKIQYVNVPYDQISEKLTTSVMAGKPFCDLINLSASQGMSAILANELLSVDEYAPKNADILNEQLVLKPVKMLGKNYFMEEFNLPISGIYIGFNRDMIKKLGLTAPDELYKKGEWTWDKFMEIAKAATKDTDGDGKIDQWGVGGTPGRLVPQLIASNDGFLLDETNKKSGLDDAKTVEALDFVNKIYNVEKVGYLVNNDPNDWGGNDGSFKDGKVALFYAETWMIPNSDPKLTYNYGIAPMPKGPSNNTDARYFLASGGVAIPRGVEKPEWAYQIFEELIDWCGADFSAKTDGTLQWLESIYLTEDDVNLTMEISKNCAKVDYYSTIPDYPLGNVINAIIVDGKTVSQAVEENKQIAQDKVSAVLK